jgi:hypothetical protein
MRRSLVLLALLAPALLAGCGPDEDPGSSAVSPPSSPSSTRAVAFPAATPAEVLGRVKVGGGACGVIVAAGRVWVSSYTDGTLAAVDPRSMKVVSTTRVGDNPCGLAYGAGSVWVENYGSFDVTRVDARTGEKQETYDVQFSPYDVTFASGAAWVTNNGSRSISRIDAASGEVTTVRTGGHPVGIAVAGGLVWAGLGDGGIAAIDPSSSRITQRLRTDEPAGWTAAEGPTVWVDVGDSVQEIDAGTGEVTTTVAVPEQPADGSAVGGQVYVPQRHTGLVAVLEDGQVTRVLDTGLRDPFVLAAQGHDLWVADFGGDTVLRVRRPR